MPDTTTTRRRLRIARDANADIVHNDGNAVDLSGVTFQLFEGMGLYEHVGAPKAVDVPGDVDGFGRRPPEMESFVDSSGDNAQANEGDRVIECYPRGVGASPSPAAKDRPLDKILNSGMGVIPAPSESGGSGPSDTVTAAGAGGDAATEFTGTAGASYAVGLLFKFEGEKQIGTQIAQVIKITGNEIDFNPALSRALNSTAPDVVRMCRTYAVGDNMPLGDPLIVQADAPEARQTGVGGRMKQLVLEQSGTKERKIKLAATVQFPHLYDDHSNASVTASTPCAKGKRIRRAMAQTRVSTAAVGVGCEAASGITVGDGVASTRLQIKMFRLTVTNTLTVNERDDQLGIDDYEITDSEVILEIETSRPTDHFNDSMRKEQEWTISQSFGPTGNGEGGGFVLPAAHLIEMDGSRHQLPDKGAQFSSFKFRAGTPRNITTPVGSEWIARAICFIGFGL